MFSAIENTFVLKIGPIRVNTHLKFNTRPRVTTAIAVGPALIFFGILLVVLASPSAFAGTVDFSTFRTSHIVLAAAPQGEQKKKEDSEEEEKTPEEKFARRFPQPVRAGALIGLPVLDENDSTIGYIDKVVKTAEGKIQLIVPYYARFGWVRQFGPLDSRRRPVAVPIETVALLARQVNALEMSREDFDEAPTFDQAATKPLEAADEIKIALGRR